MIRTVVFDLGKVLVDFDYSIAARRIAGRGNITLADLSRFIAESPLFIQYETGLVTSEEFYKQISAATHFNGSLQEFGDCFGDIFSAIDPMIELQASLRARGFPTYIFSNTNDLAIQHIRRNFPFFDNFDGYVLSYEHHAMKPDARLYEVVERATSRQGAEILYLDDRPENIATGAARGWQVILHETPGQTREAVQKLGLLGPG
jgi:HAD superfamily hydrolase (TIGR01509 family)